MMQLISGKNSINKAIVFFVLLFSQLSFEKEITNDDLYSIDSGIRSGNPTPINLSEIAESISFIKLKTRDDVRIGDKLMIIAVTDSWIIICDIESGILVFDLKTGNYLFKIEDFNEENAFDGSPSIPKICISSGKMLLATSNKWGLWDLKTGEMLNPKVPTLSYLSQQVFFINDSLFFQCIQTTRQGITSKVNLLSATDGRIVKDYGLMGKIDQVDGNNSSLVSGRFYCYEFDKYIMCYSAIHDTIYGLNKTTLELEPRFITNLGNRIDLGIFESIGLEFLSNFRESSRYLFFTIKKNSKNAPQYNLYYDKKERKTFYFNSRLFDDESKETGIIDDLTSYNIMFFPSYISPDDKAYRVFQSPNSIASIGKESASKMGITDDDKLIIMVVQLKK